MKIVHFAPFAPNACGLYEAARDMIIGDRLYGHESHFVDVGITAIVYKEYKHEPGKPGQKDERGGTEVITEEPTIAYTADIIVAHTGVPDNWISQSQAPIIWVMHGRPAACFRPEQNGLGNSYTLLLTVAQWPRVKAMLSFWSYHTLFWLPIIPTEKLVCFPAPPIDEVRFSAKGTAHDFAELGGKWNIVIADTRRDDIDNYEIAHGAIETAKMRNDVKFHFYAMPEILLGWDHIFSSLRKLNALGEVWARRPNMEEIYRAADLLLSPHRIVVRTIGEAMSCGTPVIAAEGCEFAAYTMRPDDPKSIMAAINKAIRDLTVDLYGVKHEVKRNAEYFKLNHYSANMNFIYEHINDLGNCKHIWQT